MNEEKIIISPSILAADFSNLQEQIKSVEKGGAEWIHIDIMDGHFVPNITFGYKIVKTIDTITDLFLDVHLMIENPEKHIDDFIEAGSDLLTIHSETCMHSHRLIEYIHNNGIKAGVSLNPGTPIHVLDEIIGYVELVLIMSVNPGYSGQKFIQTSLDKIKRMKEYLSTRHLDTLIEVDGGIDPTNVEKIVEAGARVIVSGATIFKNENPAEAVKKLRETAIKGLR